MIITKILVFSKSEITREEPTEGWKQNQKYELGNLENVYKVLLGWAFMVLYSRSLSPTLILR